jgi:hypothetical protein
MVYPVLDKHLHDERFSHRGRCGMLHQIVDALRRYFNTLAAGALDALGLYHAEHQRHLQVLAAEHLVH